MAPRFGRIEIYVLLRTLAAAAVAFAVISSVILLIDLVETARYEVASKLLRDTDSKIIDIAFSSGYADPAHFTRAFRRISGITPRQFREQSRL